jgi:hypothetical protein
MTDFDPAEAPATIGELRRRLEAMGSPWTVSPQLNDDDPLPSPPRGAEAVDVGHVPGIHAIDSPEEFEAHLRSMPPANPFLAARWRELGVLPADSVFHGADLATDAATQEWGVG